MKVSPADIAFSLCIRTAANHTCLRCGIYKPPTNKRGSSGLDCSHVYSRRHRTIRWCADNAKSMCTTCHRWWHENPADSGTWFAELMGDGFMTLLREKRDSRTKVSKVEEKEIAKHYREQLKILEQRRLDGEQGQLTFESWQ